MGTGALLMSEPKQQYASYVTVKLDVQVLRLVRAAAALEGKSVQDWLSDLANEPAARRVGEKPVKRLPAPPHPKRSKR